MALKNGTLQALNPATRTFSGITFSGLEVTDEDFAMTVSIRPLLPVVTPGDPLADITITYGQAAAAGTSPPTSPPVPAVAPGPGAVIETYRRVSLKPLLPDGKSPNPNFITTRIGNGTPGSQVSALVCVTAIAPGASFPTSGTVPPQPFPTSLPGDTVFYDFQDYTAVLAENTPLDKLQVFNLMVLPGIADNNLSRVDASGALILSTANAFCERKMAFLIMDPPVVDSADGLIPANSNPILATASSQSLPRSKNAALYFPYLLSPDPFTGGALNSVTGQPNEIPPAATVAGIFAATDVARGVWKAPAGFQATANNVNDVVARGQMTDQLQGTLNPLGVNCLRDFPNIPTIVFGARTLAVTFDQQWTYVPVRRMALFLEQSLYASLKWVIFEPNAQPLWTAITMTINAFMLGLFKQGAFQGDTPSQAFSVQCNSQTTTQADIDLGIVNIVVGFAPLKPAEFVIITIAQLAGQAQTT